MERLRYGKARRKKRHLSPLPGAALLPGGAVGLADASQRCRRRLFDSGSPRGPKPGYLKRKSRVKTLPKITENLEVAQVRDLCNLSNQVNVKEKTDLDTREEAAEESTVPLKESLTINNESKDSLKNDDVTSSTGMTLPTGVTTCFLECLDVDSTVDYNAGASDNLNSCPSPEIFRDDDSERSHFHTEDFSKYKNSTLLDCSKAVAIDKMPQITHLSAILEPVLEDFQGQGTRRKRPPNFQYSSSALSVSTTLAGKKVCRITAARERTPVLKTGMHHPPPLGPERKPDTQTAKPKRLKCKKQEKTTVEEAASLFTQVDVPANTSARSAGLTAEELPAKQADAVVQRSSRRLLNKEENKALRNHGRAQPAELDPPCARQEICSIVRTSPCQRPPRLFQIPVSSKPFSLPEGVPEDVITSTKNWIYCKRR
ncbi:meiosis-specific kinetochore protein [Neopsephotus bourkii]|uniref:meiosis-specific kinetochore protein n=1 Tax=Neopsephotus bourkii TaxID=309878 RepID=UPI002AA57A1F|nr:meiosis-specific kinetochore protein [Neopsephotus bourkii]